MGPGGLITLAADYSRLHATINGFRRHPEWRAAFKTVLEKRSELFVTLEDGQRALPESSVTLAGELADQEFIEDLIRRGY